MKPLTKDDFVLEILKIINNGQYFEGDISLEVVVEHVQKLKEDAEFLQTLIKEYEDGLSIELIKQWKEDAESWKFYLHGGLNGLMDIKERLEKRIEWYIKDRQLNNQKEYYGVTLHYDAIIEELQKILGGPIKQGGGVSDNHKDCGCGMK